MKEQGEKMPVTAPPPTVDAPAPGWLVGMLWTVAAWALYYYVLAV